MLLTQDTLFQVALGACVGWTLLRQKIWSFFCIYYIFFYIMIYSQLSSGQTSVPCVFTNTSIITKYHRHSLRKPLARHKFNVAASFHEQRLCETISQKMFPDYDNHTAFMATVNRNHPNITFASCSLTLYCWWFFVQRMNV